MTAFTATLPDGRQVSALLDDAGYWAVRVTLAGRPIGYRRLHELAQALAGAGAPPDTRLAREQPGQLDLFAA